MRKTRLGLVLCALASFVGCGTAVDERTPAGAAENAGGGGAGGAGAGSDVQALGSGWQLRDKVPYPRSGDVSVLDAANDRMIVFGGTANDTWALPLSGPHEGTWEPIATAGPRPPVSG